MCFCVLQINLSMASNTHSSAVEEGEWRGSPTMAQPVIPGLAPQPLIPGPRPRPLIPGSSTQTTIPAPTAEAAPEQFAGHIPRSFPTRLLSKPFLWGVEVKALGQGAFGTVILVIRPWIQIFGELVSLASFQRVPKFQKAPTCHPIHPLTIGLSTAPIPSGRITTYLREHVMSINTMSRRPLPSA